MINETAFTNKCQSWIILPNYQIKLNLFYTFFLTICRNHSDKKAYDLEGVNWHFGHRRWGLLNHLDDHIRGSMLLCFRANFVNLPFQEGEFDPSSMLRNCQRGSREGEKMLLLIKNCLIVIILVHISIIDKIYFMYANAKGYLFSKMLSFITTLEKKFYLGVPLL